MLYICGSLLNGTGYGLFSCVFHSCLDIYSAAGGRECSLNVDWILLVAGVGEFFCVLVDILSSCSISY